MNNKLYHYTLIEHLDSILEKGLIPGYRMGAYGSPRDRTGVWLDTGKYRIHTPGWLLVEIDASQLDQSKLTVPRFNCHGRWYVYTDTIPPSAVKEIERYERSQEVARHLANNL